MQLIIFKPRNSWNIAKVCFKPQSIKHNICMPQYSWNTA